MTSLSMEGGHKGLPYGCQIAALRADRHKVGPYTLRFWNLSQPACTEVGRMVRTRAWYGSNETGNEARWSAVQR